MGESLLDPLTVAIMVFGASVVWGLRSSEPARSARQSRIGNSLLAVCVGLLLFRWCGAALALPEDMRPGWFRGSGREAALRTDALAVWRCGLLFLTCVCGMIAAVKVVTGATRTIQVRNFLIASAVGAIVLVLVGAFEWALLWLALLACGIRLALWHDASDVSQRFVRHWPARESGLTLLIASVLAALLLSTWNHAVEREVQRPTRSQRYSAWPKVTALQDAWERTDWIANPRDARSAARGANAAAREQRIAWGLVALSMVVTSAAMRCRSLSEPFGEVQVSDAENTEANRVG